MIICCYCFAVCGWWFFFGYAVCWLPICWPYIDHNELCLSKLKHCICSPYFYSFVVLFVCVYRTHMIISMFEDTICFNFRWANMEHKTTWEPKWTEFRQNFGSQYYQLMSINQLATCRRKLCNYVAIQITSSSSHSHIVSFASSQQLSSSQQLKKKRIHTATHNVGWRKVFRSLNCWSLCWNDRPHTRHTSHNQNDFGTNFVLGINSFSLDFLPPHLTHKTYISIIALPTPQQQQTLFSMARWKTVFDGWSLLICPTQMTNSLDSNKIFATSTGGHRTNAISRRHIHSTEHRAHTHTRTRVVVFEANYL